MGVPELTNSTALSSDLISAVIGNIGEDFDSESSASTRSWSARSQTMTYGSEVIGSMEESGGHGIEMIDVSELRMERERVIGWDQIWAAGING
jgi:hypothetical protein